MGQEWQAVSVFLSVAGIIFLAIGIRSRANTERLKSGLDRKEALLSRKPVGQLIQELTEKIQETSQSLSQGKGYLPRLIEDISILTKKLQSIEYGIQPPVFGHMDNETFKSKITEESKAQLALIASGRAITVPNSFEFFGSKKDGDKMVVAYGDLLLRALNSEFDTIRKKMRHKTREGATTKLYRVADQLEKLGETVGCSISDKYIKLKDKELDVWWTDLDEKELSKQQRKQQQVLLREQTKSQKDDSEDLEDEVFYKQSDLKKAQELAKQLSGIDADSAKLEIAKITEEIAEIEEKLSRSMSQAQITRAGFIYVISNVGSFGIGVVKIGMTRRLEPILRVKELGDASVPFVFDVHTMAFVDDAPTIEKLLHQRFSDSRVNKHNLRKEFFRVSPEEVKTAMEDMGINSEWYFQAEAREFNESNQIRSAIDALEASTQSVVDSYPEVI